MIKAVIFDADGVLLDSIPSIVNTFQKTGEALGKEVPSAERVKSLIGRPRVEILDILYGYDEKTGDTFDSIYHEEEKGIKIMEGAMEVVQEINFPKAVVTSKRKKYALKQLGELVDYFDVFMGKEDTELHKPNPEPLLVACKKLGVAPSEAVYIGDTMNDFEAAKAAGTEFIGLVSGCVTEEEFNKAGAKFVITSLREIQAILKELK